MIAGVAIRKSAIFKVNPSAVMTASLMVQKTMKIQNIIHLNVESRNRCNGCHKKVWRGACSLLSVLSELIDWFSTDADLRSGDSPSIRLLHSSSDSNAG